MIHTSLITLILISINLSINLFIVHVTSEPSLHDIRLRAYSDKASFETLRDQTIAYKLVDHKVSFDVALGGMSSVLSNIHDGKLDFGVGIEGWTDARAKGSPNMLMLPLFLHGVTPVYRLDSVKASNPVVFTREILVKIHTGEIRRWNHPDLVAVNPMIDMPNLNITMVFDAVPGPRNYLAKDALFRFNSTAMSATNMTISNDIDYPMHKYAAHAFNRNNGVNGLATLLLNYEGGFILALQSIAANLGLQTGKMINKAGKIVAYSQDAITFNAIELGMKPRTSPNSVHLLNDPSSESAWPMAMYSYIIVDRAQSATSCRARQSLVEFLVNFYESPMATNVLNSRNIARVPSLIMKEERVLEILRSEVLCRGSAALPPVITKQRSMFVSEDYLFGFKLLSSVYDSSDETTMFKPEVGTDNLMLKQVVASEVDLAIVTPAYLDAGEWKEFVATDDYLVIPMMASAVSLQLNPQIGDDLTINKATSPPMIIDIPTLIGIFSGCVRNYNDHRILNTNPWLATLIGNGSYPLIRTVGCGSRPEKMPLTMFVTDQITKMIRTPGMTQLFDSQLLQCIMTSDETEQWRQCRANPRGYVLYTPTESLAPLLAMGVSGGTSFATADNDPTKIFPEIALPFSTLKMKPTVAGVLACAMDTFNKDKLSFDFASSANWECWRTAQQVVGIVRKRYYSSATNSSSCARGLDTLRFLHWFFAARETDTLTDSFNHVQLSRVLGVTEAVIEALNGVLCDDDTLLITLPTVWELDAGVHGAIVTLSVIGMVGTVSLMCSVGYYHNHPILRAASPMFVLLSLVGILLLFAGSIAFVSRVSYASCSVVGWLLNMGAIVTFMPIVAKVYRLHRIFGGAKLSVVKLSNAKLMSFVGVGLLIEIALMCVWQGISPLQPSFAVVWEGSPSREWHYTQCATLDAAGDTFLSVAGCLFGLLLVGATLMAFRTRNVSQAFNETKQIALSIYMTLFTVGVIVSIVVVIDARGTMMIGLLCAAILWITYFTATILVLPKILHIHSDNQSINQQQHGQSMNQSLQTSDGQFTFLSASLLDSLPMIGAYLQALKKHMEGVEHKQQAIKRQIKTKN